mmetsp:Transcript_4361/g.7068  ORF Transcript_4361/g.7068 Transcript_4361/m.7068 type:complete len:183 (-) Transcript_4361:22-570(-)
MFCFISSSVCHTLSSAPQKIYELSVKVDLLGILILMLGTNCPFIFYGFYNRLDLQLMHIGFSIVALSTAVLILRHESIRKNLKMRVLVYVCVVGGVGGLQMVHDVFLRPSSDISKEVMWVWARSVAWYFCGVIFYACKAPERLFPGRFNILFSSHQIWHVCVVLGARAHLYSCLEYIRLAHL